MAGILSVRRMRAAVNDGSAGGEILEGNLIMNFVRE